MSSKISISNMALAHIGHSKIIQSFTEGSNAANQCEAFYDIARDTLLADHHWLFAKQQVKLAIKSDPPSGWTYQYALPVNCVNPVKIYNPNSDDDEDKIPFERRISTDGTTEVIVTDKEEAELIYTQKIETVSLMPVYFVMALSYRLAELIAGPMTKNDKDVLNKILRASAIEFNKAINSDAQAFHKTPKEQASWTAARSQ